MSQKRVFAILILICWGVVLSGLIIFFSKKRTEKTCMLNYIERSDGSAHLYIPVTLNDSISHPVLFHTGASHNFIDSVLAQEIGFSTTAKDLIRKARLLPESADSMALDAVRISIGNFKRRGVFFLNGYNGSFYVNSRRMQDVGAIIGMDFIKHYNWLFNFADSTVTISKDVIPVSAVPDDQILTLDYYLNNSACMDITMNGVTLNNVVFDTGYEVTHIELYNKSTSVDLIFSKSDFEVLSSNMKANTFTIYSDGRGVSFHDTIQINDFKMQGLLALVNNDNAHTRILPNFFRRFRMMYFDSTNKQVQLYASPSDSVRNHRRDLQNVIRTQIQISKENMGDDLNEVLATLFDLLD